MEFLLSAIARFEHGSIDLEDVQARIRSAFNLVESPQQHLRAPLQLAEADLEEIRFARSEEQQRPEALAVVDRLRLSLVDRSSGPRG